MVIIEHSMKMEEKYVSMQRSLFGSALKNVSLNILIEEVANALP
jgi:hypothetical protein